VAITTWRLVRPVVQLQDVRLLRPANRAHPAVELDRQLETTRVVRQVVRHLVARRIPVRVAREGETRERVVACRGEQSQRVPALAPRHRGLAGGLENREIAALLGQEVADGEACLAAADHDYVAMLRDGAGHDVLI
jgi:hypothetical protein